MTNEIIIRHMEYDDFCIDRTGESLYSTGSITIDWGDGTTETTNNNTYSYSHNYRDFVEDDEGIQTYAGYITVTISGVEEIRDGFLSIESFGGQYVDAVTIPNNITSIGNNFCYNQEHLHYLTLSNSLTTIGDDFCYGCYLSNGLELPDSLTSIGNNFCNVTGYLDTLALPDNITTIGDNFCASSALTSFTISNSIVSIGDYFLDGCSLLTGSIIIPNSVESIGNDFLTGCGITSIIFETNLAMDGIPDYFACNCINLTNISFPDNLETIGTNFCCDCPSLTRVEFPEGLIEIGENFLSGERESMHLNKLIFPSSFRYLNYGLSGSSIDKVIFKSVIPVDMSAGYPEQFDSMIIHVPKNCTDAYANAFTEAFGDYGEDSLSDPNHYRENLTLPETTAKFGTLMRTNLKRKGIEAQRNDGLTTLINKVNDIEIKEPPSGFFGDIGIFNSDNWTSSPTITNDKIILNESSTFICNEVTFPSTFTAMFVITFYDSSSYLNAPFLLGPQNISGVNGLGRFEFPLIVKRNNGGDFEIECSVTGDSWTRPEIDYFEFISGGGNIVLSKFFYTDTYLSGDAYNNDFDSYDLWTYNIIWQDNDDIAALRPSNHSVLLFKNDSISEYYNVSKSSELNSATPVGWGYDVYWGCWSHILHNDNNEYAWRTNDEYLNDFTNYIKIIGNGQNRIDRYVLGEGEMWKNFPDANTTINKNMPFYWKIGFDYESDGIVINEDAYVQIGLDDSNYIKVGENEDGNFLEFKGGSLFSITNNSPIVHFELEFLGYTIDYNSMRVTSFYKITTNNDINTFNSYNSYNSNSSNDSINKVLPYNLYKVVQGGNAKIKNLYYVDNSIAVSDKCKKNKTALYGSSVALQGSSSNTLTFNNDEYLLSGTGNYFSGREIVQLRGAANGKLRVKIKLNTTSNAAFNQFLIIYTDETTTFGTRIRNDKKFQHFDLQTEEDIYTHSTYYSDSWFYLEAKADNEAWTVTLYDDALNILATDTQTWSGALSSPKWYIGLQTEKGENYSVHIKEIFAEKLEGE